MRPLFIHLAYPAGLTTSMKTDRAKNLDGFPTGSASGLHGAGSKHSQARPHKLFGSARTWRRHSRRWWQSREVDGPPAAYASDTAPRQFARLTDSFQHRLAAQEEIEEAAKDLYAVLNADQQKIASQSLLSTVPTFVSAAHCVPTDSKARTDKRDAPQCSRRGGATGSGLGGPG